MEEYARNLYAITNLEVSAAASGGSVEYPDIPPEFNYNGDTWILQPAKRDLWEIAMDVSMENTSDVVDFFCDNYLKDLKPVKAGNSIVWFLLPSDSEFPSNFVTYTCNDSMILIGFLHASRVSCEFLESKEIVSHTERVLIQASKNICKTDADTGGGKVVVFDMPKIKWPYEVSSKKHGFDFKFKRHHEIVRGMTWGPNTRPMIAHDEGREALRKLRMMLWEHMKTVMNIFKEGTNVDLVREHYDVDSIIFSLPGVEDKMQSVVTYVMRNEYFLTTSLPYLFEKAVGISMRDIRVGKDNKLYALFNMDTEDVSVKSQWQGVLPGTLKRAVRPFCGLMIFV